MDKMSTDAWVFMISVWTIILGNMIYCFYKLLTSKRGLSPEGEEAVEEFHSA